MLVLQPNGLEDKVDECDHSGPAQGSCDTRTNETENDGLLLLRKLRIEPRIKPGDEPFQILLKISASRCAVEGDHVPDILHPRRVHHKSFKAKAEPGVRRATVLAKL